MNQFKRVFIIILAYILIFTINISSVQSYNIKNSDSKAAEISKFIPEKNELLLYSNYKNNEINRFIKQRFTNHEIKKINIIKNGLISFIGFNLNDNLNNIYNGEFALSIFNNSNQKSDILIVFKVKDEGDINKILDNDENNYKTNQIIKIERPKTLNLITHIIQTKDNYIICATNKDLIFNSLQALNNPQIKNIRENKFQLYKSTLNNQKLFLYTSKYFNKFISMNLYNSNNIDFITKFNFENNHLILNTFSLNNDEKPSEKSDLIIKNKNDITLLSRNLDNYKEIINNSIHDKVHQDLFEDISNIIKDKIFIQINKNNWVICFKKPRTNFSISQFNSLNNFHQDQFKNDDDIYTIFSKNNLEFLDQQIIHKVENPIFIYETNNFTFISNDLSQLLNTLNVDKFFKTKSNNTITEDNLIIRNFTDHNYQDFLNIINPLNFFTIDGFSLSVDTFESSTSQKIPEILPSMQFKTYIEFS
tara:strand:+ start:307 stop:1737 length:1431 start_codon:yes stop_codon:yes gene_type:complete